MQARRIFLSFLALVIFVAASLPAFAAPKKETTRGTIMTEKQNLPVATLAGGCFWCVESDFKKFPGVVKAVSGYAGGQGVNPNYEDYARKGYVEAVQVYYDPQKLTYQQILDYFWRHMDPTDAGGQKNICEIAEETGIRRHARPSFCQEQRAGRTRMTRDNFESAPPPRGLPPTLSTPTRGLSQKGGADRLGGTRKGIDRAHDQKSRREAAPMRDIVAGEFRRSQGIDVEGLA